jgi:hypothetical protein
MKAWLLAGLVLAGVNEASEAQPAEDTVARIRICLRYDGAAREECFGVLWQELTRDTSFPPPLTGGGDWIVSETMSPIDYSPQITATKVTRLTSGNAPSLLTVGCRGQRTEVSVGTTATWRPLSGDDVRVYYRINSQPEVQERWAISAGGRSAVLRGDAGRLLSLLPDPGQLGIRVLDAHGPTPEATFDLAGLDPVRQKVTAACRPAPARPSSEPQWR